MKNMLTKIKKTIAATICISTAFFAKGVLGATTGLSISNDFNMPSGTITGIVSGFLSWLLAIFGVLGIIGFIISGIIYLVSTGDDTAIERAKKAMMYSILGIVIGLAGFVIMQAVFTLLAGNDTLF